MSRTTSPARFASLDHISDGRSGWNVVTTSNPDAALNFGLTEMVEHDERYRRAREFYDVVTGLWDSWADDAWLRDQESGLFFDPDRLHVLDHKGEHLSVRGPLNIGRPMQGWPVIVQAGASDAGRQFAAETSEAIFASSRTIEEGRAFFADMKSRVKALGRSPDHMKILPGALVTVGRTLAPRLRTSAPYSIALCIPTAACRTCQCASASMPPLSISMARYLKFLRPTRARAGATRWSPWRAATT